MIEALGVVKFSGTPVFFVCLVSMGVFVKKERLSR